MSRFADAPNAARKVAKTCAFTRQSISKLSKSEQHSCASPAERQNITRKFADNLTRARAAIAQDEDTAKALSALAAGIGSPAHQLGPYIAQARRFGCLSDTHISHIRSLSERHTLSAEPADRRLQDADDDIRATLALCALNEALPTKAWDVNHRDLRALRSTYQTHLSAAKQMRTE